MKNTGPYMKACAAWPSPIPEWINALATACESASLRKTAVKLDVSPAIVSLAINNKRKNLNFIKERVEQRLLAVHLGCPILGLININRCLREQAKPYSPVNPQRVKLYRACRNGCPHYKEKKNEHSKTT